MRKILSFIGIAIFALSFAACGSDDDEPTESAIDKQAKEIAAVLNGTFTAQGSGNFTYELTFKPYATPKQTEFTIPGEYANIEQSVTVYGTCDDKEYLSGKDFSSTEWRYIINIAYEGAQPELWLYPISITGKYETHDITIINSSSFILDDKLTYTKE